VEVHPPRCGVLCEDVMREVRVVVYRKKKEQPSFLELLRAISLEWTGSLGKKKRAEQPGLFGEKRLDAWVGGNP
jgi:hypothetical protein